MAEEKHQGWANRETWLAALWLNNEQSTQAQAYEIAGKAETDREAGRLLIDWLDEQVEMTAQGFFADLLRAALARVDEVELGRAFREES